MIGGFSAFGPQALSYNAYKEIGTKSMGQILTKNIGFFIYVCVCVILIGVLSFLTYQSHQQIKELKEKNETQKRFFREVRGMDVALTAENVSRFARKEEAAASKMESILRELRENYYVPPERKSAVRTQQELDTAVEEMRAKLQESGVSITSDAENLSFDEQMKSDTLPSEKKIPRILKYITLVRGIVNILAVSEIKRLSALERLTGYELRNKGLYNRASFRLASTGTPEEIRGLINNLHASDSYVFIVRNIELNVENRTQKKRTEDGNVRAAFGEPLIQAKLRFDYIEFPPAEASS